MTQARSDPPNIVETIPRIPRWVTSAGAETLEDVAFLSGAALFHLHLVLSHQAVPQSLLRDRLVLRAAEACVTFSGRTERSAELRDAVHLLRPGDLPGPAGETCLAWQRAVDRPVSVKALQQAQEQLQKGPPLIKAPSGYVQQSPWLTVANKQLDIMGRFMTELGLSPSARARLRVPGAAQGDDDPLKIVRVIIGGPSEQGEMAWKRRQCTDESGNDGSVGETAPAGRVMVLPPSAKRV